MSESLTVDALGLAAMVAEESTSPELSLPMCVRPEGGWFASLEGVWTRYPDGRIQIITARLGSMRVRTFASKDVTA